MFLQVTWKLLFKNSPRDHGSLGHLFTRLGQLPHVKVPKNDMHACQDALLTVFKGHIVAAACIELGIEESDASLPTSAPVGRSKDSDLVSQVAERVVKKYTVVPEAILGELLDESKDAVYNYARLLCHFAALVYEFIDA